MDVHSHSLSGGSKYLFPLELQVRLTFNMFSDEGVIHYVTVIRLQDFLKLCDVIVLVGTVMKNKQKNFDKTLL